MHLKKKKKTSWHYLDFKIESEIDGMWADMFFLCRKDII